MSFSRGNRANIGRELVRITTDDLAIVQLYVLTTLASNRKVKRLAVISECLILTGFSDSSFQAVTDTYAIFRRDRNTDNNLLISVYKSQAVFDCHFDITET